MTINIKLFYKTQRELSDALNTLIDSYWDNKIAEEELIKTVINIFHNNKRKMLKNNDFTTILKQQTGKRRLEVIENILRMEGYLK